MSKFIRFGAIAPIASVAMLLAGCGGGGSGGTRPMTGDMSRPGPGSGLSAGLSATNIGYAATVVSLIFRAWDGFLGDAPATSRR